MRRRATGHDAEESGSGMERWLLTYSDMITLLLALFVILFALSVINEQKFHAFELGLTRSFSAAAVPKQTDGVLPKSNDFLAGPKPMLSPFPATLSTAPGASPSPSLEQIAARIRRTLTSAGLSGDASVSLTLRQVVVQLLADRAYFALDSARLGKVGDDVVDAVATVLRTIPNDVEVQGYTDDLKILGGPFSSNWELSAARSAAVVNRLVTLDGITPDRLSAIGYATTHPAVPNTSAANRAKNRRIDVVVLTASSGSSAGPAPAAPPPSTRP